jgi:hypothetical protein
MSFFKDSSVHTLKLTEWLNICAGQSQEYLHYQVVLPMIQRGFVWKPNQIIDLWDSLLQGMPIGTLMLSEMKASTPYLCIDGSANGQPKVEETDQRQSLGLVDGQQRTLAMLLALPPAEQGASRIWVDLGDEPPQGYLMRLRVTTRNHPFGYRRDNPNARLSMDDRRCAKESYEGRGPGSYRPHPNGAKLSLCIDLADLLREWKNNTVDEEKNFDGWKSYVYEQLKCVEMLNCGNGKRELQPRWPDLPRDIRDKVYKRVDDLALGLTRFFEAEIPLLRVDSAFFDTKIADNAEPPLARLFKRIGSNATPLSDADYIYSVLKYMMPEVHQMVENLHRQKTVASLMMATDLVMSALRLAPTSSELAAVTWEGETDRDNPTKKDFHRMIWRKDKDTEKRQHDVRQMLEPSGNRTLEHHFNTVQDFIAYGEDWKDGIPNHLFPYLERPLIQVLLRLAQAGYLDDKADIEGRYAVLRLVLWWIQWVQDKPKASRIAFKNIKDAVPSSSLTDLVLTIYEAIIKENAGIKIQSPDSIQAAGLDVTRKNDGMIYGDSRFEALNEQDGTLPVRHFYRHWWRPWTYQHPMLLWLQRDYVDQLEGDPMAGKDEETPYDFDHILPRSHWGDWTGKGGDKNSLLNFVASGEWRSHEVIGNAIGNVRVVNFSDNRHDGDASPKKKFGDISIKELKDSAIEADQMPLWFACSPTDEKDKKKWNGERAVAFQQAVETRTFTLYKTLYNQVGFESWIEPSNTSM